MKQEKELQPNGSWKRPVGAEHKPLELDYCRYCGVRNRLTKDHIFPKSRGGGSRKRNLQPLCLYCNQNKGDKTELELYYIFKDIVERGVWYEWEQKYYQYLKWLLYVQKERGVENCKVTRSSWYNSSYGS